MSSNNKKIHLEPCPYCGGKAYIDIFPTGTTYINCMHTKKCKVRPDTFLMSSESLKKQIKAWNMRIKERR